MNDNKSPINKLNGTGIRRLFKATYCSIKGFKAAWIHESAFRQELLLVLILLPFSFVLAQSTNHWLVLIFSLLFLLFSELVNSALEALADKVCLDHDELIGRAKDIGSAIVFIALVFLKLVWIVATLQYFSIIS
ncbi:diacylglycerol kinase [Thalassotalea psychrophila]|uniref:Diacylglycerol kinase n=1 Tax=Thalassotalea psychrophila TaxID=3065647 RepID=A0ABY9TQW9_9GAMM|nr:diacylglycerol kinase [Colwelliaceae bacterium SQ149]